MDAPHYLRFARNLALATTLALPACSGADAAPPVEDEAQPARESTHAASVVQEAALRPSAPAPAAPKAELLNAEAAKLVSTDAPPDAGSYQGHSSGPLPPPEMPASMA